MVECKRCGYNARSKYELRRHLQKVTPCTVKNENIAIEVLLEELDIGKEYCCNKCGKKFAWSSNRYHHQKLCEVKQETTQELKDEIKELKKQIQNMQTIVVNNNIVNNNTTNIVQQNINIQINNFGSETYNHLTDEFITTCLQNEVVGVKDLIEKIHFSNEVPENKNVRLKSIKNRIVEIANNESWVVQDATEAMDTMIKKGKRLLERQYYESDIYNQELENLDMRIQDFLASIIDKNSQHYHALRRRIFALIIQQSNL